jgi:hypothetical protein
VVEGRNEEGAETFSKDSSRLSPSSVPVHSRSMGNACKAPGVAESSPSEESETEWSDETEEACMWPWARRIPSEDERSLSVRGSVAGGISMLLDWDVVVAVGLAAGAETERGELNDNFRGGKGGAPTNFGGDPSKLMRGALSCGRGVAAGSGE